MEKLNVLVAGGGIGGMTAALCLAKAGHQVTVLEQAPTFDEAGAGIQLSPNAARVLHHLGLERALRRRVCLPEAVRFRHWRSGKLITESPLGRQAKARYGAPYYHIHRGDLLQLLVDAGQRHERIELRCNARVGSVVQTDAGIEAATDAGAAAADVLVGADGIHSTIRASLFGRTPARFTGNVAWRTLVAAERLAETLARPGATVWWGPGGHFVHYAVRRGAQVNCVCVVEKTGWELESWTEPGELAELEADFAGWHETVQQLIAAADPSSLYKWALFDRPPMRRWRCGAATLLGDACHPMLPFLAQGAAMAIEDAAVLAACLSDSATVPEALDRYEALRRPRTSRVQADSRRNAKLFHLSGICAWARNAAARFWRGPTMDGLYGYNALQAVAADEPAGHAESW